MFRQMKKLLKLLNEYRKEKGEKSLNEFEVSQTLDSLNYLRLFIKWLVENEKIDRENEDFDSLEEQYFGEQGMIRFTSVRYRHLMMLLATQNEPINFLISILK